MFYRIEKEGDVFSAIVEGWVLYRKKVKNLSQEGIALIEETFEGGYTLYLPSITRIDKKLPLELICVMEKVEKVQYQEGWLLLQVKAGRLHGYWTCFFAETFAYNIGEKEGIGNLEIDVLEYRKKKLYKIPYYGHSEGKFLTEIKNHSETTAIQVGGDKYYVIKSFDLATFIPFDEIQLFEAYHYMVRKGKWHAIYMNEYMRFGPVKEIIPIEGYPYSGDGIYAFYGKGKRSSAVLILDVYTSDYTYVIELGKDIKEISFVKRIVLVTYGETIRLALDLWRTVDKKGNTEIIAKSVGEMEFSFNLPERIFEEHYDIK